MGASVAASARPPAIRGNRSPEGDVQDRVKYHFGTGRGPVHRHASAADEDLPGGRVDGRPDAVRLDFDGDGRVDDLMWDADGDGVADHAVLDLDDDGRPEHAFTDPAGRGVWDTAVTMPGAPVPGSPVLSSSPVPPGGAVSSRLVGWTDVRGHASRAPVTVDSDGDGVADAAVVDADHDPATVELACDPDDDGRAEELLVDHAHDGAFEDAYLSSSGPGSAAGRWDVMLADVDGDGAVEVAVPEGMPGWVPP